MNQKRLALSSAILVLAQPAFAVSIVSTWVGPQVGNWNVPANWNPAAVPANGADTYAVTIDGPPRTPYTVTLNTFPVTVDSLTIGSGDTFVQPDNADFSPFSVVNNGTWLMQSAGNLTDVFVSVPELTIGGSGVLEMSTNQQNRIYGSGGLRRLVNGPGHTIRGSGQIGLNLNLNLTNEGLIDGNQSPELRLDLTDAGNFNTGTLQASSTGTLTILNTAFDNTGGTLRAIDDGAVGLEGASINGGTFETSGNGAIRLTPNASGLAGIQNIGLLQQPDNADVYLNGDVTNDGLWSMQSAGNLTDVLVNAATVTIGGSGVIEMSDNIQNRFYGTGGLRRLVNGSEHTIRGTGQIGLNLNLNLTNDGLVDADQPNGITLDLSDLGNVNAGVLQASSGGTLRILNSAFDNSTGVIRAIDDGVVRLEGANINGGPFETADSGAIQLTSNASGLAGVQILGLLQQPDNADVYLNADLTNDGLWSMQSAGNLTDVYINADTVTIGGNGVVEMSDNSQNRFYGTGGLRRLVNGSEHTIRGSGQIGLNLNLNLTNDGLIDADQPTPIVLDLTDAGNVNAGTLQASGNGTLVILNSNFDNAAGVIRATGSGVVSLQGANIADGPFETEDDGVIQLTTNASGLIGVANNGKIRQPDNADVYLNGDVTNNGTWAMQSAGNPTDVFINAPTVTIGGNGAIEMSDNVQNRFYGTGGVRRLVNGPDHTIRGTGQFGLNLNFDLTNSGTLIADQSGGISIDVSNDFLNEGTLQVTGAGAMTIHPGAFDNTGAVLVDAGRTLTRNGTYHQSGGLSRIDGTLQVIGGGSVVLEGGVLGGNGTVNSTVANDGGTVAPGDSAGALAVAGNYTQTGNGTFEVELGGSTPGIDFDTLAVGGNAALGGTISIRLLGDFMPAIGQSFVVLTAGSVSGLMGCLDADELAAGYFRVVYGDTTVTLVVATDPLVLGDLNQDGFVNGADLGLLLASWSQFPGEPGCGGDLCCPADLNGDGFVDGSDLGLLLGNWS
ncbi:MAG: hypothetical protein KDA22_12275 [Phycisphaerales bacterium]|nr:hypothetical protein [Phycisphaerales bacterium]